jgi:hypothetical protein
MSEDPYTDRDAPGSASPDDGGATSESSVFLRLINRYISVWVWSILFGLTTSLSFTITNVRNIGRFGELSLVIGALYLVSALFVFHAWFILLGYLRNLLIPMIFSRSERAFSQVEPIVFRKLSTALASLILALMSLMVASVLGAALEFSVGRP